MKLDRNINTDGRGKYALVHMRKLRELTGLALFEAEDAIKLLTDLGVIRGGGNEADGTLGEQFFVIKYKDMFAPAALQAYSVAAYDEATRAGVPRNASLLEYSLEISREAAMANKVAKRIPD